jgi:hypothetical protein
MQMSQGLQQDIKMDPYQLATTAQVRLLSLGQQRTPLVLIDHVLADVSILRQQACAAAYATDGSSMYPGLRSPLPRDYIVTLLGALYPLLYRVYQIPPTLKLIPKEGYFSLLTTPEAELQPMQCLPHFDSAQPYFFAVLHYLSAGVHGGTGFFRHKPTGFERITQQRQTEYFQTAQQFFDQHGAPPQRYQVASDQQFELYQQLHFQQNRLLIYPGNLLHSSLVQTATDLVADPAIGRLTANMFLNFEAVSSDY